MKRILFSLLVLVAISSLTAIPAFAMDTCDHSMSHDPTVAGLIQHVGHVYEMGHIDSVGVKTGLTSILNGATVAAEPSAVKQQVQVLQAFIKDVSAQSGKHIDAGCADHLIMHAEHVIMTLQGQM